jgi:DNA-binding transcriptional LysR family regulator
MDRLDAMTVLLAVVEQGSLSAASRHLRSPLATVSRKVSELEAHLNAQLLQRSNRKITLTEAGRSYVEAAREILDRVEEAERTAAGEYSAPKGELTMTAPDRLRSAACLACRGGFPESLSRYQSAADAWRPTVEPRRGSYRRGA